jgi:small subunit ribosomal protein S21
MENNVQQNNQNQQHQQGRRVFFKRRYQDENAPTGLAVAPRDGEPFDSMLRRFKRIVDNSGILKEYRERQEYKSPSEAANAKRRAAEKRRQKANRNSDR